MNTLIKNLRVIISLAFMAITTATIVSSAVGVGVHYRWIFSVQIIPCFLEAFIASIVAWLIITTIFGRVYCSSVCPLGTLQDFISRLYAPRGRESSVRRYRYRREHRGVRLFFLIVMLLAVIFGTSAIIYALDPFSAYVHIIDSALYPSMPLDPLIVPFSAFLTGIATAIVTVIFSLRWGRLLCNTLCPVGTLLGYISARSLFRFDINADFCNRCGKCEDVCKSSCINLTDLVVDGSRCVDCFNCVSVCPHNAIRYTTSRHRLSDPLMQPTSSASSVSAPASSQSVKSSSES